MDVKRIVLFIFFLVAIAQNKVGDPCVDENTGATGTCVSTLHCQSAKKAFENNGVRPTFCQYSFDEAIVCCKERVSHVPPLPTTSSRPPQPVVKNTDGLPVWGSNDQGQLNSKRISRKKCEEYSRYGAPQPSKTVPNELIIGGEPSELNEFPHMAAIGWLNYEDSYSFNCGGSLISTRWVLTAGHCTRDPRARDPNPAIVRLGDLNIDPAVDDGADPDEIPIKSIIRHPSYAPPLRYHDVALIQLARPAQLTAAIHPACLFSSTQLPASEAVAIGWGVSDVKSRKRAKVLQKVALTLQDTAYCDRLLYVNRNRNWNGFVPEQLCAGELRPGKDTCQGDSGAPLQIKWNNMYYIIGITSFGLNNCAESGRPAVYSRVSSYVAWIEGVVWPGE